MKLSPVVLLIVLAVLAAHCHVATSQCTSISGSVTGKGVKDCDQGRAERDATNDCASKMKVMRDDEGKQVRKCSTCSDTNGAALAITNFHNYKTSSIGSGRWCNYIATYKCCVEVRDPWAQTSTPANVPVDGGRLVLVGQQPNSNVNCACRQTTTNPKTGATISCTCYYVNQAAAKSCPGAKYGSSSGMYFREC